MTKNIFYYGISGLLYLNGPQSCAAALPVQHVPNERNLQHADVYSISNETCSNKTQNATMESDDDVTWDCMERNRLKLIISKLMLSASCTSETEYLIDNVDDIFVGASSSFCPDFNTTARTCILEFYPIVNETTCIFSGGQFYDNFTEPNFYRCININNDDVYTTDINLLNYPICIGASCNESEVKSVLDGIMLAELDDGGFLRFSINNICNSKPVSTSSVHSIYNDYGIFMCFTFTILASVIYAM